MDISIRGSGVWWECVDDVCVKREWKGMSGGQIFWWYNNIYGKGVLVSHSSERIYIDRQNGNRDEGGIQHISTA